VADILPTLSGLGGSAFTLLVLIVTGLVLVVIVVAILLAILNARKYNQFKIIVFQKDGAGNTVPMTDKGGVFVDGKTGNKRLFLRDAKVGLSPDNIPFLVVGKEKWVFVLRTGLKNYRYIYIEFENELFHFKVGEEDVNWALNVYEAQKKRFATGWLAQYMPFIIIGFTSIIMLIMFIWLFNKLGMILEIAQAMQKVAESLAQATGTTIIPKP
jgi:hypothetical protein